MGIQNRKTLKEYFKTGGRPSASNFEDLIDSSLIMNDEGFIKTPKDGLRVITLGSEQALLSLEGPNTGSEWSLRFGDKLNDVLSLRRNKPLPGSAPAATPPLPRAALTFSDRSAPPISAEQIEPEALPFIGVGAETPRSKLDVNGVIRSTGRVGRQVDVAADGAWKNIATGLTGCVALEVVAGVGAPTTGRFALMSAIALNTYNPSRWDDLLRLKTPIRQQHAYYSRRGDRLQLRWSSPEKTEDLKHGRSANYTLQIRSRTAYLTADPEPKNRRPFLIRAFVTRLWFDPDMAFSTPTSTSS